MKIKTLKEENLENPRLYEFTLLSLQTTLNYTFFQFNIIIHIELMLKLLTLNLQWEFYLMNKRDFCREGSEA